MARGFEAQVNHCGAGVDGTLTGCTGVCCLNVIGTASSCYCDDILTSCIDSSEMEVQNCEVDIAPCADGEQAVDSCKD